MRVLQTYTIFDNPYNFMDGQYGYLSDHGIDIYLCCSDDERAIDFANRNNIHFYPIEFVRTVNPIDNIKSFIKLYKFVKKHHFDVVVGNMTMDSLMLMIIGKLLGIKHRIYYRHGLLHTTQTGIKRWIMKAEEKFVSSLATKYVEVSPSVAKIVVDEKLAVKEKQVLFNKGTCNGVDALHRFNPDNIIAEKLNSLKQKYQLSYDNLVFGFCGRFCKDKGLLELVDGFNIFRKKYPQYNSKLLLIGELDTRDCISDSLIKEMRTNPDIITTGKIDKEEMAYYYKMMDVFVFPSHREGFGMVTIEASAMEVPVLTTKSHGCVDSIENGKTGLYVDISGDGIFEGMQKMLDCDYRKLIGKQGRKWVLDNFDCSVVWPEVLKMYRSLN